MAHLPAHIWPQRQQFPRSGLGGGKWSIFVISRGPYLLAVVSLGQVQASSLTMSSRPAALGLVNHNSRAPQWQRCIAPSCAEMRAIRSIHSVAECTLTLSMFAAGPTQPAHLLHAGSALQSALRTPHHPTLLRRPAKCTLFPCLRLGCCAEPRPEEQPLPC